MSENFVIVGGVKFPTELALTTQEQERGLMYQEWPPPVMSFIYASPRVNKFWMKNTVSPLDIVFCRNGKIISINYGEPNSNKIIGDDRASDLVIEFPRGTCEVLELQPGDPIEVSFADDAKIKILMLKVGLLY